MNRKNVHQIIRESRIEEYRTLRQEILEYTKYQKELTTFAFSGSAAIFTLAVNQGQMYILLSVYILLVPLRCWRTFYQELIIKIAAYISTVIELSIYGMEWEHLTHSSDFEYKMQNDWFPSRLVYFVFSLISWIGVAFILSQIQVDTTLSEIQKRLIIFISIISSGLISYLDWTMLKKVDIIRKRYELIWKSKV